MKRNFITILTIGLILVSTGIAWGDSNNNEILNHTKQLNSNVTEQIKQPEKEITSEQKDRLNNDTNNKIINIKIDDMTINTNVTPNTNVSTTTTASTNTVNTNKGKSKDVTIPPPIQGAMGPAKLITEPSQTPNSNNALQNGITEINTSDLKFSNNGNFEIGKNTIDDFKNIYKQYFRYSNSSKSYFGDDSGNNYGTFSISVKSDSNKIVKEISVSKFSSNKLLDQFVTSKGIKLGSTVKQMQQAYGQNCITNIVDNPNNRLATITYNFKNGKIIFYTKFSDASMDNALIYSITISLN